MRRIVLRLGLVLLVAFVAIQLVPYGRDHSNPDGGAEPAWDSERTRELAVGACYDCHSNDTEWPWYSNVAPMSWLVMRDVENGRDAFNFQDPEDVDDDGDDAADVIEDGEMPPSQYKLMHPDARLERVREAGADRRSRGDVRRRRRRQLGAGLAADAAVHDVERAGEHDRAHDGHRDGERHGW